MIVNGDILPGDYRSNCGLHSQSLWIARTERLFAYLFFRSVAEATETRKAENAEYTAVKAQNNAAVQLLGVAENRLNKSTQASVL